MRTPWGTADSVEVIADGITSVSTPSHGGIHLSAERLAEMPEALRALGTTDGYGSEPGGPWFEEDCDWAAVAVAFPDEFGDERAAHAAEVLERWHPEAHDAVLGARPGPGDGLGI